MSSTRVSGEDTRDSTGRVTKKVKTRLGEEASGVTTLLKDDKEAKGQQTSFKEALLNVPGVTGVVEEEVGAYCGVDDEDLPENRWYKEVEDPVPQEFLSNGTPIVSVSDGDFQEWCEPWQQTLVINVLGKKKLNFRVLENKILRDWAKVDSTKIIDLPRAFYAVQFESVEDYNRVLF